MLLFDRICIAMMGVVAVGGLALACGSSSEASTASIVGVWRVAQIPPPDQAFVYFNGDGTCGDVAQTRGVSMCFPADSIGCNYAVSGSTLTVTTTHYDSSGPTGRSKTSSTIKTLTLDTLATGDFSTTDYDLDGGVIATSTGDAATQYTRVNGNAKTTCDSALDGGLE